MIGAPAPLSHAVGRYCFALLFMLALAASPARAQVCPGPVVLTSQAQVDSLDCAVVEDYLEIIGDDITDLTPLGSLTSVGDYLSIDASPMLTSLDGLENVTSVGGDLIIGGVDGGNAMLTSIDGIRNVASIGGYLIINNNPALSSLTEFSNVTAIGGISINANVALTSLDGLESVTSVDFDLAASDNHMLTSCACGLAGLISGEPPIFSGVSGNVLVGSNDPAGQCNSPGDILEAYPSCETQVCSGDIELTSQAEVEAFDCTEVTGSLAILGTGITSLVPLSNLTSVGSLRLNAVNNLSGLAGLENLSSVSGYLRFHRNEALLSLSGLENLTSVGDYLHILGNESLQSLTGLENVTSVGDFLRIADNDALTSLNGLEGITSTGGSLQIAINEGLESLAGLESITYVGGSLQISGNALTSLSGLEQVTTVGNNLSIYDNFNLSDCACGIAGLISGEPPVFAGVEDEVIVENNNPTGECTSPEAILAAYPACTPVANETPADFPTTFALGAGYPNPAQVSRTPVRFDFAVAESGPVRVVVYDLLGREVARLVDAEHAPGRYEVTWDGRGADGQALAAGAYLVRMAAGAFRQTQRLTVVR